MYMYIQSNVDDYSKVSRHKEYNSESHLLVY